MRYFYDVIFQMYGRAHLRYMHGFIGPPLFNLCMNRKDEPKKRQVLLFNSSRILISISNFTVLQLFYGLTMKSSANKFEREYEHFRGKNKRFRLVKVNRGTYSQSTQKTALPWYRARIHCSLQRNYDTNRTKPFVSR